MTNEDRHLSLNKLLTHDKLEPMPEMMDQMGQTIDQMDRSIGHANHSINHSMNQSMDQSMDPGMGSPTDETMKSRTKLSVKDIRLILYLIITIKPFKYIGDRSLSQTKKWELIQHKYSEIKGRGPTTSGGNVIPTVRTLQRQLSSAIKKAKFRKRDRDRDRDRGRMALAQPMFKTIKETNSLPDLELAVLELFELSETLKNGKIADSSLLEYSLEVSEPVLGGLGRDLGPGGDLGGDLGPGGDLGQDLASVSASVSGSVSDQGSGSVTGPKPDRISPQSPKAPTIDSIINHMDPHNYQLVADLEHSRQKIRRFLSDPQPSDYIVELVKHLDADFKMAVTTKQEKVDSLQRELQGFTREQSEINRGLLEEVYRYLRGNDNEELVERLRSLS